MRALPLPQFDEIFGPYVQYCVEQVECQKYCRQQSEGELFTVYLAVSFYTTCAAWGGP